MAPAPGSVVMTSRSICAEIFPHPLRFHHLPCHPECAKILDTGTWSVYLAPALCPSQSPAGSPSFSATLHGQQGWWWAGTGPWEAPSHNAGDRLVVATRNALLRNGAEGSMPWLISDVCCRHGMGGGHTGVGHLLSPSYIAERSSAL